MKVKTCKWMIATVQEACIINEQEAQLSAGAKGDNLMMMNN